MIGVTPGSTPVDSETRPILRIDAHQHFWRYDLTQYPWMQPGWPIRRDYLPADLAPLLDAVGFDGSIAVQARQSLEETRWLLELADQNPRVLGVVGWVDLRDDRVEEQLARFSPDPRFVGVRHVVQDEPDDRFLVRPEFRRGIGRLRQFRLGYDLLIFPKQLPAAIELVAEFPEQPFVLDHIAKPAIREGTLDSWRQQIRELACAENVCCKISGLVTEAKWNGWRADDFRPYLDVVFEAFGPGRLMFGSDWPVCLLAAAEYAEVFRLVADYTRSLTPADQAAHFGGNAARFYLCNRMTQVSPDISWPSG